MHLQRPPKVFQSKAVSTRIDQQTSLSGLHNYWYHLFYNSLGKWAPSQRRTPGSLGHQWESDGMSLTLKMASDITSQVDIGKPHGWNRVSDCESFANYDSTENVIYYNVVKAWRRQWHNAWRPWEEVKKSYGYNQRLLWKLVLYIALTCSETNEKPTDPSRPGNGNTKNSENTSLT